MSFHDARILIGQRTRSTDWAKELIAAGAIVEVVTERAEYERRVRDFRPDIFITDLDGEGFRSTAPVDAAKVIDPSLTVLVTVEVHQMSSVAEAMQRGAAGFLVVPVNPQAVRQVVQRELQHRDVRREVEQLKQDGGVPEVAIPGSTLNEIEKVAILRSLEAAGGSTGKAAKMLGISVRKIQYRLREWKESSPGLFQRQGNRVVVQSGPRKLAHS